MNIYAWPVAIPVLSALAAVFALGVWLAVRGLRETCRLIRFRHGAVPDDGPKPALDEALALAEMDRCYRQRAPEPVHLDREDRT